MSQQVESQTVEHGLRLEALLAMGLLPVISWFGCERAEALVPALAVQSVRGVFLDPPPHFYLLSGTERLVNRPM